MESIDEKESTGFDAVIERFGTQAKLASALEVHPMAVTQWKKRGIPPRRAQQIVKLMGGAVQLSDLLPDFFT